MIAMVFYFVFLASAGYAGVCSEWQWPLFLTGACACAFAVGHLGASLGPWADRTSAVLCSETPGLAFADVSANLLANYAIIGSVVSTVLMLMLTALQLGFGWGDSQIITIYGVLCLLSIAVIQATREPPAPVDEKRAMTFRDSVKLLLSFYGDPRALLLSVLPLATGCLSSWKTAGLTALLKQTLGSQYLGLFLVAQASFTIIFAKLSEHAIHRLGAEAVMFVGSLACVAGPALYLFTDLAFHGWWIVVFYVIVGLVWAVYETAARAIVLEHFRGKMAAAAFSSMTVQMFFGGMVFYFMDVFSSPTGSSADACAGGGATSLAARAAGHPAAHLEREPMAELEAWVVLVLGLLVMPCLFAANSLKAAGAEQSAAAEAAAEAVSEPAGGEVV